MKPEELLRNIAKEHGLDFVDLGKIVIPPAVIKLMPELVARENGALPLALDKNDGALKVVVSDPMDYDTREKLRFVLNRNIQIAIAPREMILKSINKYYEQIDG